MTCPTTPRARGARARRAVRGWRRVFSTAAAAALIAGPSIAATGGGAEADSSPAYARVAASTDTVPVRVATYNIHNDASYTAARSAVNRLVPKADVIGLQEFYSPHRIPIMLELAVQGWAFYKPLFTGADPVLYDTSVFDFVSGDPVELTGGIEVEDPKASFRIRYSRPSYATVVRLRHKASGRLVTVVNAHLIARATKDGRPHKQVPLRVAAYKRGMAVVASTVAREAESATVYAVGDWNIHYNFDARERVRTFPFRQFKRLGFESVWKTRKPNRATINSTGVIDGVWAANAPARAKVLGRFPESDHRPVVAKYRLPVRG